MVVLLFLENMCAEISIMLVNHLTPSNAIHTHTHIHIVRQKAKEIVSFLQDDERLREARKVAKQTRDKYVGYSASEATHRYS